METTRTVSATIDGMRCGECEHLTNLAGNMFRCSLADEGMVSEDGGLPYRNFMCLKIFDGE